MMFFCKYFINRKSQTFIGIFSLTFMSNFGIVSGKNNVKKKKDDFFLNWKYCYGKAKIISDIIMKYSPTHKRKYVFLQ